jgi:hypothetical protein
VLEQVDWNEIAGHYISDVDQDAIEADALPTEEEEAEEEEEEATDNAN